MAATQLVELNHRHMAIAEYLLANPSARLPEVAAAVGMTPSWVSVVTNSELFREYLQQRNREVSDAVHISLQEKVQGIAHRAVEKLGEAVDNSQDPAFILAAADKTLQRLGYGAKPGAQVNISSRGAAPAPPQIDVTIINAAREKVYALAGAGGQRAAAPENLPPGERPARLGSNSLHPAAFLEAEEATWTESPGGEVRAAGASTPGGGALSSASTISVDPIPGEE